MIRIPIRVKRKALELVKTVGRQRRLWLRQKRGVALLSVGASVSALSATPLYGESATGIGHRIRIEHLVEVRDPATKLFHVTSRYVGARPGTIDLALPVWTPGSYGIKNYAANIRRMSFADGSGRQLRHRMLTPQRWRVEVAREVIVSFDYFADELGTNAAKITPDFAIFTGTQLFLEPVEYREAPSTVRFVVPGGWRIATALSTVRGTSDFAAASYDELVDAPTVMGLFDTKLFNVDGVPHRVISVPQGVFDATQLDTLAEVATEVARIERRIFDNRLPYDAYTYFLVFQHADSGGGGGLEHGSSFIDVTAAWPSKLPPAALIGAIAHEYFHLWNVKRIRPAGMWPYDYSHENYTSLLWFSEGFTNYFANLTRLRTGRWQPADAMAAIARSIQYVDTAEARRYVSPSDASVSTWENGFSVNYYGSGQVLGELLDLLLLHDTNGRARLDDVMHRLWHQTYLKGRGVTEADILRAVNTVGGHSYAAFFRRYVDSTEPIPYDSLLVFAGFRIAVQSRIEPVTGMTVDSTAAGWRVSAIAAASPAALALVNVGDIIIDVAGQQYMKNGFDNRAGQTVAVSVKRGVDLHQLTLAIGSRSRQTYALVELPTVSTEQLRTRSKWLQTPGGSE